MPRKWLLKLSGHDDDLRELSECFSFPNCSVVSRDGGYYLTSERFNSFIKWEDARKEAENLVRIFNGLSNLKLSNWWEIKIATAPGDVHIVEDI